jgi:glucosamine 6-phosphate synthetase-like amidotransferase/phosphosugar isomerase protein
MDRHAGATSTCGICSHANHGVDVLRHKILASLVNGLKHLEYRGCNITSLTIDCAFV